LELVLVYYQKFAKQHTSDSTLQSELADAFSRAGQIQSSLGYVKESLNTFEKELKVRKHLADAHPESSCCRNSLGLCYYWLGQAQRQAGKHAAAIDSLQAATRIFESSSMGDLRSSDPGACKVQFNLAQSYDCLGIAQGKLGKTLDQIASHRKAMALLEQLVAICPETSSYRIKLAGCASNLAGCYGATGKFPQAVEAWERALEILDAVNNDDPQATDFKAVILLNLTKSHENLGHSSAAQTCLERATKLRESLAAAHPFEPGYQFTLSQCYTWRGFLQQDAATYAEAEASFARALKIQEKLAADFPAIPEYQASVVDSCFNLGAMASRTRNPEDGAIYAQKALVASTDLADRFPDVFRYRLGLAQASHNAGLAQAGIGNRPKAIELLHRSVEICKVLAVDYPVDRDVSAHLAVSYFSLGCQKTKDGDLDRAIDTFRNAIKLDAQLAAEHPSIPEFRRCLARDYNGLACAQDASKKAAEAIASTNHARAIYEELVAKNADVVEYTIALASTYGDLASIYDADGHTGEATKAMEKVLELAATFPEESRCPALLGVLG
jgi:tetratricopeptide (TPR) repeat protein